MLRRIKRHIYNLSHPVIGEVWQLHRVTEKRTSMEQHRPYEITPTYLEKLIFKYMQKGFEFISIKDVFERNKGKFVSVTLDDGFLDNYEQAYPIFKKYNIPFCIYIMQEGVVSENDPSFFPYLTEDHIRELSYDALCTIGCHTYSHPRLAELSRNSQKEEIEKSLHWLEDLIGRKIEDFSYPFGSFNDDSIEILSSLGIKRSCLAFGGPIRKCKGVNPLMIPRVMITDIYR